MKNKPPTGLKPPAPLAPPQKKENVIKIDIKNSTTYNSTMKKYVYKTWQSEDLFLVPHKSGIAISEIVERLETYQAELLIEHPSAENIELTYEVDYDMHYVNLVFTDGTRFKEDEAQAKIRKEELDLMYDLAKKYKLRVV